MGKVVEPRHIREDRAWAEALAELKAAGKVQNGPAHSAPPGEVNPVPCIGVPGTGQEGRAPWTVTAAVGPGLAPTPYLAARPGWAPATRRPRPRAAEPARVPAACTYCGQPATARDHLEAVRWSGRSRRHGPTVPACTSCNSILGDIDLTTVAERGAYVAARLRRKLEVRYSTTWTEQEISELGRSLMDTVQRYVARQLILQERIQFSTKYLE